jgi:hypothetical protein
MASAAAPQPRGTMPMMAAPMGAPAKVINIGGFLPTANLAATLARAHMDAASAAAAAAQAQPVVQGLAAHIRTAWTNAKAAKTTIEQEMIEALLARRGEYTAQKLAQIREQRQPAIYMMVGSAKMRQVEALLRDVMVGAGDEKPWTTRPTPVPELPPTAVATVMQQLTDELEMAFSSGFPPTVEAAQERLRQIKDELTNRLNEEARLKGERVEKKMEDQLVEGGFLHALSQFITDLATFKTAFLAGPILRNKPKLSWGPNDEVIVEQYTCMEWERISPFDVFPASWARHVNDGPLCIKHRLSRQALNEMEGVDGYSDDAIREVLARYNDRGFREWTSIDSQLAVAEGKEVGQTLDTGLIDAIQFFGSASGQMLIDWGMTPAQVADPTKEYQVEAWLVDNIVIKAVLNADPLGRRNIFCTSFQKIPGSVWGSSPFDLMRDCQDMCNAAARSLAANMGISSGPQVWMVSSRLPSGEDVTEMYPWKIWQFEGDPMGSTAVPMGFFQPTSNANELMSIYERFSLLADEYTGIPRYMAGFNGGEGGAGRTASGISMMISNASKTIKQVAGNVDLDVLTEALQRLHYHNRRFSQDPDFKGGDINIVALGALSLVAKESAQQRTIEYLQATANPIDMQILGLEGRAELHRRVLPRLDLPNPDKVVPPAAVLRQRMAEQAMAMMVAQQQQGMQPGGTPKKPGGGEQLQDGTPTTDNFSPKAAA